MSSKGAAVQGSAITAELTRPAQPDEAFSGHAMVASMAEDVFQATSMSLDPLIERADLNREVFLAGVITEFVSAVSKMPKKTRTFVEKKPKSYLARVAHQAASFGLDLGPGPTGRMASIVFRAVNERRGDSWDVIDVGVAVQPEWRGVVHLIKRANPAIVDVKIGLVGPDDRFEMDELNDVVLVHSTPNGVDPCEPSISLTKSGFSLCGIFCGYAIVTFSGGRRRSIRVTRADITRSAAASETMKPRFFEGRDSRETSPWVLYTKAMCYKTVVHALYRKPDVWAAAAGMDFVALTQLRAASEAIDEIDANRIVPVTVQDKRVDALMEAAIRFGGSEHTVLAASKAMGFDDPTHAVAAGRFQELVAAVKNALKPK